MGAKVKILRRRRWKNNRRHDNFSTELVKINCTNGVSTNGNSALQADPLVPAGSEMARGRREHLPEDTPDMAASRPHASSSNKALNNNNSMLRNNYSKQKPADSDNEETLQAATAPRRPTQNKQTRKENTDADTSATPLTDETDLIKNTENSSELQFKWFDIFINLFSIGSFLFDIGTDIFVAVLYLKDELYWYFGFTVAFICVPAIINTIFGIIWYVDDHRYYKDAAEHEGLNEEKPSTIRWIIRVFFLLLQIGPILRYIDVMVYGCKSWFCKDAKKRHLQELMVNEDADAALLRLLECFIEAAPQLTLQLYVLCIHGGDENLILKIGQVLACFASLSSLSWALMAYGRSLRMALPEKANTRALGMVLQFIWRFFMVGCRILCLALFASVYGFWIFVLCGCHWFVMFIWMAWMQTNFCSSKYREVFFNMVIAAVHIFCFVNVIEGHTRLRYLLYYVIILIENIGLTFGWYIFAHTENIWYLETAIVIIIGGFFLGLFFQILYYVFFHPNNYPPFNRHKRIRLWVSLKELWHARTVETRSDNSALSRHLSTDGQKRMMSMSKYHHPNCNSYL